MMLDWNGGRQQLIETIERIVDSTDRGGLILLNTQVERRHP